MRPCSAIGDPKPATKSEGGPLGFSAIVLAAGTGARFGGGKLAARFRGEALLTHAIRAARAAPVESVIVVHAPELLMDAWSGQPDVVALEFQSNGLAQSLKAGVAAAGRVDGVFVFLGDMPLVPHEIAGCLVPLLKDNFAVVPRYAGKPGHPVLLARRAFSEVAGLAGDEGAGRLLRKRSDVAFLDCADDAVLLDVDRIEDLARLEERSGPEEKTG